MYLFWNYYQWDKGRKIIINNNTHEQCYRVNNQTVQTAKLRDIVVVKEFYRHKMLFSYYRIILKESETMIQFALIKLMLNRGCK